MSKSQPGISVLTANRLSDGAVVFLDLDGVWAASLRGAVVARTPDEARALESRGAFDAARNIVVEPYLVEMHEGADGSLAPVRFRERVRLGGPSVLDDVPGYAPAASVASRGEADANGQTLAASSVATAHPQPLPINGERQTHAKAA
jgi:Protein of unknown function (DUF2849)